MLQPPCDPSVGSFCHPWFTTTNLSYRFPIVKLPLPPCAVLLVQNHVTRIHFSAHEPFAYHDFYTRTSFHCRTLTSPDQRNSQKLFIFWHSNSISCKRIAAGPTELAKQTISFNTRTSFRAKGLPPDQPYLQKNKTRWNPRTRMLTRMILTQFAQQRFPWQ